MATEPKKTNTSTPDLDSLNAADMLYAKINQRMVAGVEILKKYNGSLDLITKYQSSLVTLSEDFNTSTQASINNNNKLKQINDAIVNKKEEIKSLTADIKKLEQDPKSKDLLKQAQEKLDLQEKELNKLADQNKETQQAIKTAKKSISDIQTTVNLTESNLSTLEEIAKNKREIGKSDFKTLDYARNIKEVEDQIVDAKQSGNDSLAIALKERLGLLQIAQKESDAQDKINTKISAARDNIVAFGDKLLNLVPGGKEGFLGKMLGLDTISKNLKDKVGGAMAKAFEAAGGGMKGFFAAGVSGAGSLMAALAPILPILLAIAAVAAIAKLFLDADKAVSDLSKSLGVSYKQAALVRDTAGDIANEMGMVGVTLKEVTKQMVDLKAATGINFGLLANTNQKAKDFLETSTLLTAQYGMTAEETVVLNQAAAILGSTSDKLALSAEKFGDELVSSTEIMREIGKVSKAVLFNFKGNVPALAAAVKQAKLMGTTLDKVAAMGDKLVDIEQSLVAESKAKVLLGRNLNLDAARYYALMGQEAQLMEEIKKQAGSVAEYDKMSKMQKKALAEALGMSNDELAEMMAKEKELELLGYDAAKLEKINEQARAGQLDLAAELNKMSSPEAKARLKAIADEERRAGVQEKLATLMARVTDLLYKLVEPLIPMVDNFVTSLGDGKEVTKDLIPMFKSVGEILVELGKVLLPVIVFNLKMAKALWEGVLFILKPVMQFIGWIADGINRMLGGLSDSKDSTTELKSDFGFLEGIAKVIGSIIGGWFVLGAAKKVFNVFKSIKDTVADTGKSFKNIFSKKIEAPEIKTTSKVPEVPEVPKVPDTKTPEVPDVVSKDMSKKGFTASFKDNMRNLADGFKAMGEDGVGKGILNTLLAGPALLIAIPAIPFILFMGKTKLDNLFNNFYNLASGLTAMAEIKDGGLKNTAAAGVALIPALGSIPFIFAFNKMSTDKLKNNFTNLSSGINAMSEINEGGLTNTAKSGPALLLGLAGLPFIFAFNKMDTSKLKDNFTNLANGVNEMSEIKDGGLKNIILVAPALIIGLGALPFIFAFNKMGTDKLESNFTNLSNGINKMSEIKDGGLKNITLSALSLILGLGALPFIFTFNKMDTDKLATNFANLAAGINSMATASKQGLTNITLSALSLILGLGALPFIFAFNKMDTGNLTSNFANLAAGINAMSTASAVGLLAIAGSGPALLLGLIGLPFIFAFNKMDTSNLISNFTNLAGGLNAMSSGLVGVAALAAFAVAAILAIPSLVFLGGIALLGAAGAAGLTALGGGLEALGAVAATGLPFLAVALIAALGVAMIPFAAALYIAAPALEIFANMIVDVFGKIPPIIEAVGGAIATIVTAVGDTVSKVISTIAESILKLEAVNPLKIAGLGYSLGALAVGLGALTAGSIISGLASFFGADPVDIIKDLETIDGEKLKTTADGISGTAVGLESLNKLKLGNSASISKYMSVLDDISSITGLSSVSKSIKSLAQSLRVLKLELNGITKKDIDQLEEFIKISKQNTGQNVVQIVSTSIGEATEKVKDGISFLSTYIYDSISNGFSRAKDSIKEWLGFSPSRIGKSIYTGIQSVSPRIKNSLVNTFKEAAVDPAVKQWLGKSPSKIGNDIETGIASKAPDIFNTLKGIFKSAAEDPDVKQWLGKSPSKLGKSIYAGIHSVEPMIGKSLLNPFKKTLKDPVVKSLLGNKISDFGKSIAEGIGLGIDPYIPNTFKKAFQSIDLKTFDNFKLTWNIDDSALTESEKRLKSIATKFLEIGEGSPEALEYYRNTLKALEEKSAEYDFYKPSVRKGALKEPLSVKIPLKMELDKQTEDYFKSRSPSKFGLDIANGVTLGMETIPKETKDVWNNVAKNATKTLGNANPDLVINTNVDETTKQVIELSESIRLLNEELKNNSKEVKRSTLGTPLQQTMDMPKTERDSFGAGQVVESETLLELKALERIEEGKEKLDTLKPLTRLVKQKSKTEGILAASKTAFKSLGKPSKDIRNVIQATKDTGLMGGSKQLLKTASKGVKGIPIAGTLISAGLDTGVNLAEGKDWKESLGRAGINLITSGLGGFLGSALGPIGTVAGAYVGDQVGDYLGDLAFGSDEEKMNTETPKPVPVYSDTEMKQPYTYRAEVESTGNTQNLQNVEYLLGELVRKVDQPVLIKVGDRTINEMSNHMAIRRSYAANLNTGR